MDYTPRKLISYEEGIIKPSEIEDAVIYSYTRPFTILEFFSYELKNLKKEELEEIICRYYPDDSFIRKEPSSIVPYLSEGIKDFDESEGKNIFDVFQKYSLWISATGYKHKKNCDLEEQLNAEKLFIEGGDCKTKSTFLINRLRHHKFPCRAVYGFNKKYDDGHMWVEVNYDGLWTPFESQLGISLLSNEAVIRHYSEYPDISFSKP